MQRLLRKFETAKRWCPSPCSRLGADPARFGAIYYGSTRLRDGRGARAASRPRASAIDALRVRAFPFQDAVIEFVTAHDHVFVVEQNRDAQLRTLLVNEARSTRRAPVLRRCTTTARRSPRASSAATSRSA